MKKARKPMNKEWHQKNVMPENPTLSQRIDWHLAHAKNCGCREIPQKLKAAMQKRNMKF